MHSTQGRCYGIAEIESAVADGAQSVILNQVTYGIAIRMAVLSMAMRGQTAQRQAEQENA